MKEGLKKIAYMISDNIIRNFLTAYKVVLDVYICELVAFAIFYIGNKQGMTWASPGEYVSVYEAFCQSEMQNNIVLFILLLYYPINWWRINVKQLINNVLCLIILYGCRNIRLFDFLSIEFLKGFIIYTFIIFLVLFIAKIVRRITYEGDSISLTKPMGRAGQRTNENCDKEIDYQSLVVGIPKTGKSLDVGKSIKKLYEESKNEK